MPKLTLISHDLCPYVQRAVIALTEKGVPFGRRYVDLANKPDWFLAISPLGKVPLLQAGDAGKSAASRRSARARAAPRDDRVRLGGALRYLGGRDCTDARGGRGPDRS